MTIMVSLKLKLYFHIKHLDCDELEYLTTTVHLPILLLLLLQDLHCTFLSSLYLMVEKQYVWVKKQVLFMKEVSLIEFLDLEVENRCLLINFIQWEHIVLITIFLPFVLKEHCATNSSYPQACIFFDFGQLPSV